MFAKQGNGRNKISIKQLTQYALFVAVCLIAGYLENLFIVPVIPGVKIGVSNAIALMLIYRGDKKGAWAVNITRICLSSLLFGSPMSFLFSLSGGVASTAAACLISKTKNVSCVGISIASGTVHNIFQLIAAAFFIGVGIIYYLPILILLGAVCGAICGFLAGCFTKFKIDKIY
ncbi:MAG: Gx transporter family protein [Clostridia bacterium]|nr:Gx transporter family protein [Clostridia bacterium]